MAGGQYRLCWCAGKLGANGSNVSNESSADSYSSCSHLEDFRVDFGGLLVMGVAPLKQSRTCVSGASCIVEGFTGFGLTSADGYMILETCGVHSGPLLTLLPFDSHGNVSNGWSITRRLGGGDPSLWWLLQVVLVCGPL